MTKHTTDHCPSCGGNDMGASCAYPSEGQPGCLRDKRLAAAPAMIDKRIAEIRALPTPETDALWPSWREDGDSYIYRHFAAKRMAEVEQRLAAEAQKDAERLDLIERTGIYPWKDFGGVWKFRNEAGELFTAPSLRDVLDAALAAERRKIRALPTPEKGMTHKRYVSAAELANGELK